MPAVPPDEWYPQVLPEDRLELRLKSALALWARDEALMLCVKGLQDDSVSLELAESRMVEGQAEAAEADPLQES